MYSIESKMRLLRYLDFVFCLISALLSDLLFSSAISETLHVFSTVVTGHDESDSLLTVNGGGTGPKNRHDS